MGTYIEIYEKNLILFASFAFWIGPSFGAMPTGCTYDSQQKATGIYTCQSGSYTAPLTYSDFSSPLPQRLKITNLNGNFGSSPQFSGFSSFTSGLFDKNYAASLELVCAATNTLTLTTSTFTDMGYLQEVTFTYCNIASLSNGMLGNLGNLNSLIFQYGSIASYSADFLTGVSIQPLTDVPEPKGEFAFKDCSISPTTIPSGVFDSQTSARTIKIDKAQVSAIDSTVFSSTTQLKHISLKDNTFTTLDNALFDSMKGLSSVEFDGILYACTCSTLGVLEYAIKNSVFLPSDLICNSPVNYQKKKASSYYEDVCQNTSSCSGVSLGSMCLAVFEIVGLSLLVATLIISSIALGIICHSRRQLDTAKKVQGKRKTSRWSTVKTVVRGRGRKPPMKNDSAFI